MRRAAESRYEGEEGILTAPCKADEWDREKMLVDVNGFVSLLTQGACCWIRLWAMRGYGSFCPACWQYQGTLAVRSCPSASSPASVGAAQLDSPWEQAAWSLARWHLLPKRRKRVETVKCCVFNCILQICSYSVTPGCSFPNPPDPGNQKSVK